LVTDEKLSLGRPVTDIVARAVEGGVTMVQLREKTKDTRAFIDLAAKVKEILKPYNVPLIINDRIDVALAVNAEGVHIGQHDMPYPIARKLMPKDAIIGLSVETINQVKEAEALDVNYLGISPVFSTPTKTDVDTSWGIKGLNQIRKMSRHKLVAIGSIKPHNAAEVIQAGADGIAVVSGICSADDPKAAAQEFMSIVKKTKKMSND
jgi:thiamine-phosphate pyrophosphorylase